MKIKILSACFYFYEFIKCNNGLLSTHSVGVYMHSIDSSFFVFDPDEKIKNCFENKYDESDLSIEKFESNLEKKVVYNVNVMFTDENPSETEVLAKSVSKRCDIELDEIKHYIYAVKINYKVVSEQFVLKKYIVLCENDNSSVIFYFTHDVPGFRLLYGSKKDLSSYLDCRAELLIIFHFPDLKMTFEFHDSVNEFFQFFETENAIMPISASANRTNIQVFFKILIWKQIEEILKPKSINVFTFDRKKLEWDENLIIEINKTISLLEENSLYGTNIKKSKGKNKKNGYSIYSFLDMTKKRCFIRYILYFCCLFILIVILVLFLSD